MIHKTTYLSTIMDGKRKVTNKTNDHEVLFLFFHKKESKVNIINTVIVIIIIIKMFLIGFLT